MRVYQIARQLEKPHRALLQLLRELGHKVPSHMARLEPDQEEQLREALERQERGAPAVRAVRTTSASVQADQVARVVGQIDLEEAAGTSETTAGRAKTAKPAAKPVARKKKEPPKRPSRGRDEVAEEYAREAEREGLEMVQEEAVQEDFIGPPLPPDGAVVRSEVIRTIDLSQIHPEPARPRATTTTPASPSAARDSRNAGAPVPRSRRRTAGHTRIGGRMVRTLTRRKKHGPKVSIQASQELTCVVPITIKDLSQVFGVRAQDMIKSMIQSTGEFIYTMNTSLDEEQVEYLAAEFERSVTITAAMEAEDKLEEALVLQEEKVEGEMVARPPVVTILGHVDHGKTSLLDKIRSANVVDTEHGGITQHIGAFQVQTGEGDKVTFLDTPGHAAFTAMRARGANTADIVILVVAADDGVMPQTEESITHATVAKVPIVVAINKCDKPEANVMKVKQQLAAHGLTPEDWGGETTMCEVSAHTGDGIDSLLEMLALTAEMGELTANPSSHARGRVVEARKDPARGVVCTLIVEEGTLKGGDTVIAGLAMGRIRTMTDHLGKQVKLAPPSTPVEVFGLSDVPEAGEPFHVVKNAKVAKKVTDERRTKIRESAQPERPQVTLATLFGTDGEGPVVEAKELKIILKADVRGSLEPLKTEIDKLEHPEVRVNMLYGGLGGITRSDVDNAIASNAVIMGFHVTTEPAARREAERRGVEVRQYTVIYEIIDDLRAAMENMLAPERKEEVVGHAEIRRVFLSSKLGRIAGSYVTDGVMKRNGYCRLYRGGRLIYGADRQVEIGSLRRIKDDVKEVREGFECGIRVDYQDIKEGDVIECYEVREVKRTLDQ